MRSMYALYFEEYENMYTVEDEKGFATYKYDKKCNGCYIVNIFVKKEYRKTGHFMILADKVVAIAKEKGYNKLIGSVDPESNNPERSRKVLLKYGMEKLNVSGEDFEWYVKEI